MMCYVKEVIEVDEFNEVNIYCSRKTRQITDKKTENDSESEENQGDDFCFLKKAKVDCSFLFFLLSLRRKMKQNLVKQDSTDYVSTGSLTKTSRHLEE